MRLAPRLEDLRLAFGADAGAQLRLAFGGLRLEPGQRVQRGLRELTWVPANFLTVSEPDGTQVGMSDHGANMKL